MDWFRQIQIHLFKGYNRATILVVITLIITRQIHAPDSYEFRLGTNGIIPFSYALDEHFQYCWEIFRVGVSNPFNINGTMKPDALNPSQRDRFNISTTWGEDVLRVDLHIREISKIDRGVYVWAVLQHTIRAKRLPVSFDVFVDVILPPGRAKCDIVSSPYDPGLREVHCQAAVGSDGDGLLICYQNDVKTPFQSAPDISATDVTAVFWMDVNYDINCCSHEANYEKVPGDCNDFTKAALIESDIQSIRLGTNAIIPFSYALDEHSQHCWEIFRIGVSDPFNINGTMKPDALNPSQRHRFNISTTWGEDVLRVDLHIRNISTIDRGVYVWAVSQQTMRVKRLEVSFHVFVDVILPPGRANCDIFRFPYISGLREVHCQAAVGSDGGGLLICYQNDVKTPFQCPPERSATDVTAVFWMDAHYDIKCCSHEANYEKVPGDCNDFTKAAPIESDIQPPKTTRKLDPTTLKKIGKTVSPSSPIEREHFTVSASSTEETTYFRSDQCVCNEFIYIAFICILSIALVISVCMNVKNKFNSSTNDKYVEKEITESKKTNIKNKCNNCTKDRSVEKEITESEETKEELESPPPVSKENHVNNNDCKV